MASADDLTFELKKLVENSHKILITSHVSPDPDAVCSLLLLGTTLKTNFPEKDVQMSLEEMPDDLDYLSGFKEIKHQPTFQELSAEVPDLFILVDGVNYDRCSRQDGDRIRQFLQKNPNIKTAIIDHHEAEDKDSVDLFINQSSPATSQDIYDICFKKLNLKKPDGWADTALLGIYADTGGFAYLKKPYQKTFEIVAELLDAGSSVESIKNRLNNYSEDQLSVISELAGNVSHGSGYTYSFLSDEFVDRWQSSGKPLSVMHTGCKIFIDNFIRNIDGRLWGFVVYRDLLESGKTYSLSLRSAGGNVDVSLVARSLNGGGHKPAAGGRFESMNISSAIEKVKQTIQEVIA